MSLTAKHVDGRIIDSTDGVEWAEVHLPGYKDLRCPCNCGATVVARASDGNRVQHFAKIDESVGRCHASRISPEHVAIQAMIVEAIREMPGWTARSESTGEGFRADVLAKGPNGERYSFEVQLSPIHAAEAMDRTERHARAAIKTIWLDGRKQEGLRQLRSVLVRRAESTVGVYRIARGGQWEIEARHPGWFAQAVCRDELAYSDEWHWATREDREWKVMAGELVQRHRKQWEDGMSAEKVQAVDEVTFSRQRAAEWALWQAEWDRETPEERVERQLLAQARREREAARRTPWSPPGLTDDDE